MNPKLQKFPPVRLLRATWRRLPEPLRASRLLSTAVVAILLNFTYWAIIASDRYVSEAHVVIDRTDVAAGNSVDFTSLLGVSSGNGDMLLLRDFLLSTDMAERLDGQLKLREHYSDWQRDPLSRLWFKNGPREWFYDHYRSRITAEADDMANVLRIRVEAYSPEMSQAIAKALVSEGERFMNDLAHGLAREQVAFLEAEVDRMGARLREARARVIAFQDRKGYVSPEKTVEGLSTIFTQLEGDLARLRAQRRALLGYLSHDAPDVVRINLQIDGLEKQLAREKARLASPRGAALNTVAEQYSTLQLEAEFALDVYRSSLVALEKGRVDATRTMKKVSVVQTPQLPDLALEPRRLYNIILFTLAILLVTGVSRLVTAIIRDHKD